MGSGFISRSDDVPDPIAEGSALPEADRVQMTEYGVLSVPVAASPQPPTANPQPLANTIRAGRDQRPCWSVSLLPLSLPLPLTLCLMHRPSTPPSSLPSTPPSTQPSTQSSTLPSTPPSIPPSTLPIDSPLDSTLDSTLDSPSPFKSSPSLRRGRSASRRSA